MHTSGTAETVTGGAHWSCARVIWRELVIGLTAIIVEDHVGGRKISYDPVKFHRVLTETLVKKGVLTSEEIEALYKRAQ